MYHLVLQFVSVSADYVLRLVFHGAIRVGFGNKDKCAVSAFAPFGNFSSKIILNVPLFSKSRISDITACCISGDEARGSSSLIASVILTEEAALSAARMVALERFELCDRRFGIEIIIRFRHIWFE